MIVTSSLLPADPPRLAEEASLQRSIVQYARWALPANAMMFAVPNGGQRSKRTAAQLSGQGVMAGIPDLILWHDSHTLGVEIKIANSYPSAVQRQVHDKMRRCGIQAVVVRSLDEYIRAVESFGIRLHARPNA